MADETTAAAGAPGDGPDDDGTDDAYARGAAMLADVYAGDVVVMPEGTMAFNDVMIRTLFAEVWARDVLSMRDRRLLLMGVIAASGAADVWSIQAKAALARGELEPDELRETLVMLAPYAGYPRVSALVAATEAVIADRERARSDDD